MSEMNPATAGTRIAVEFVTLWMEQDRLCAAERIARILNDPDTPDAPFIVAGQCNLAMLLVLMLAKERGAITADQLRTEAGEILQELSRDLPE
jgi:hypothetical protein